MSKSAKKLRDVIFLLMAAAGGAFVLLAGLAASGLADRRLAAVAIGITLLAAGGDGVAGALVADWERVGWKPPTGRPTVPAGRLSSLGFGLLMGSVGILLIGLDRVLLPARLVALAVAAVGFLFTLVGQSHDWRRAEAAPGRGRI